MDNIEKNGWFEYADNDFEAAIILSNQQKPKFEIICYHCQQSAEKMLKGYIAIHDGKLLRTHDLVVLCETCSSFNPNFESILETCSDLTIFASEVRYPGTSAIEVYHMNKAINDARIIRNFIFSNLSKEAK
jgi:HEPN domain-containing protein